MRSTKFIFIAAVFLFSSLAIHAQTTPTVSPMPDAKTLILEAQRKVLPWSYSYIRTIKDTLGGRPEQVDVYEVYKPSTNGNVAYPLPMILLERNGKPQSEKSIEKQRKQIARQLEQYETARASDLSGSSSSKKIVFPLERIALIQCPVYQDTVSSPAELDNLELSNVHKEMLDGRECYVYIIGFRSNANLKSYEATAEQGVKHAIKEGQEQIVWIDVADGQLSREEFYDDKKANQFVGRPLAEREKTFFRVIEYKRGEDGKWLESVDRTVSRNRNTGAVTGAFERRDSNYKMFNVEIKDAKVDGVEPKKPKF